MILRHRYMPLRRIAALSLIVLGLAVGMFSQINNLPIARAACSGSNLYLGGYYKLPDDGSHPDFEQVLQALSDVPGQLQPTLVNGLPVPTSPNPPLNSNTGIRQFDWYTPQYQIFTRLDNNPLTFSNDNTPNTIPYFGAGTQPAASAALPANQGLFAVHWHANLVAPPGGLTIPYSFALDDAGWVYLDGQLQIDHGGIHPPDTFTGNFTIPAGSHAIDIFFADRHTVNAVTNFQLGNLGALLDCGSPNLNVVKSVQPNATVNPGDFITYTVQVTNSGNFTASNTLIRDVTPVSTSFVTTSVTPVSSPAVGGAGEIVWNVGTLLPGQSQTITFVVQVNPNTPPALAISNSALASSDESGGVVFRSNGVSNIVNATANLAINKIASPPPGSNVNIGDLINYTITVNNPGNVSTSSVIVDDPLPAGTNFVAANPTPQSVVNNRVRWFLAPIAPGATVTLTLSVRVVTKLAGGLLQNRASASSNGLVASSPLVSHNVNDAADTSLGKSVGNTPVVPGAVLTYTLQASNAGPVTATNVVVSDTLSPFLTLLTSVPPTTTQTGNNFTWNLGDLAVGQTVYITYTALISSTYVTGTQISNRANVGSDVPEIEPLNNTAVADVPGNNAPVDATATKLGPPIVTADQTFLYTIIVTSTNGGDNVLVTDTLPTGLNLVPEQTTPPALGTGPTYIWNIGRMEPNSTRFVTVAVRPDPGLVPGTLFNNTANIEYGTGPTRTTSTSNNVQTQIARASNLSISKATPSTQFQPGQPVTFVITVRNNATSASGGVTVTDSLPAGFVLQSANPAVTNSVVNPDGTTTLEWRLDNLPPGVTQLSLVVSVPANFSGTKITNVARLRTDTPNSEPNQSSNPIEIPRFDLQANLVLDKNSTATSLQRGQAFAYTLKVNNTGPIEAREVVIQDPLPIGLTFVSSQPAPTSLNPLTWNIGNLASDNGQASITLIVTLDQNFVGTAVSNGASVTTLSGNSNQNNSTSLKIIPINAPPASATPAVTARVVATATPRPTSTAQAITPEVSTPTNTPRSFIIDVPTVANTPMVIVTEAAVATASATLSATATNGNQGGGGDVTPTVAPTLVAIATATPLAGLPNTGKAIVAGGGDWQISFMWWVCSLLLIGIGIWLFLAKPKRR